MAPGQAGLTLLCDRRLPVSHFSAVDVSSSRQSGHRKGKDQATLPDAGSAAGGGYPDTKAG